MLVSSNVQWKALQSLKSASLVLLTAVAYFILGKRLGCLDAGEIPPDCKAFIDAVDRLFTSTFDLVLSVPFYLLWET